MKKTTIVVALAVISPAAVFAQGSAQAHSHGSASAEAQASKRLSASAQVQVDADIKVAREKKLPEQAIRQRVAEGQAKGAAEAQIVAASRKMLVDLQASHDAMVKGGHAQPSDEEVTRGAQLLARGYTSAQLEAVAQRTPSERSLSVAFDVLTRLQAEGKPTANAVAQVEGQLAARASDAQLRGLVSGSVNGAVAGVNGAAGTVSGAVSGSANANGAATSGAATSGVAASGATQGAVSGQPGAVAGSAAAGATAAVTGAKPVTGSVAGGVTGAVSGTLNKKP